MEIKDKGIVQFESKQQKSIQPKIVSEMTPQEYEDLQVRIQTRAQAYALEQTRINQLNDQKIKEAERLAKDSFVQLIGLPTKKFVQTMLEEIKQGNYIEYHYSKHIASVKGGHRVFNVSGFKLNFTEGETTIIPKSLYEQAIVFIEGIDHTRGLPDKLSRIPGSEDLTADDKAKITSLSGGFL